MKNIHKNIVVFVLLLLFQTLSSQIVKEKALVKGECGMCKDRIETTAIKTGAKSANWTAETQTLEVEFDASKISLDKILKNLADVGHDNEKYKTDQETYENLPECCHYDRKASFEEIIAKKKAENSEETTEENHENHQENSENQTSEKE